MSREPFTDVELDAIEDLTNYRRGDDPVDEYARLLIADLRAARHELAAARAELAEVNTGSAWLRDQRDALQAALTAARPETSELEGRHAELYAGRGMARRDALREQRRAHAAERRLAAVIALCDAAEVGMDPDSDGVVYGLVSTADIRAAATGTNG